MVACRCCHEIRILGFESHRVPQGGHGELAQREAPAVGKKRAHAQVGIDSFDLRDVYATIRQRRKVPVGDPFTLQGGGN